MSLFEKRRTLKDNEYFEWVASEEVIAEDHGEWLISQKIQCVDASGHVFPGEPRIIVRSKPLFPRYFKKPRGDDVALSMAMSVLAGFVTGSPLVSFGTFLLLLCIMTFRITPRVEHER
jgi:hypothetical protein